MSQNCCHPDFSLTHFPSITFAFTYVLTKVGSTVESEWGKERQQKRVPVWHSSNSSSSSVVKKSRGVVCLRQMVKKQTEPSWVAVETFGHWWEEHCFSHVDAAATAASIAVHWPMILTFSDWCPQNQRHRSAAASTKASDRWQSN